MNDVTVRYSQESDAYIGEYLIDGVVYATSAGNSSAEAREAALSAAALTALYERDKARLIPDAMDQLQRELAEARKDTKRFDFYFGQVPYWAWVCSETGDYISPRAAIDAAMKASTPAAKEN